MVAHLEAKDDDIVQVNSKGSGADGDLQEKQLSPPTPPLVNSAANGNGCAAGSGKTDFISTKMNLVDYPNVQILHPIPSTGGSAHVNSNVSNIQKKRRQSQQAAMFPTYKRKDASDSKQLPPVISFFIYICEYAMLLSTSSIFQANKGQTNCCDDKSLYLIRSKLPTKFMSFCKSKSYCIFGHSLNFRAHNSSAGEIKNKLLTDKHTTIWLTLFPTNMVLRVNINQIEPPTRDWICKVQIVEISRPRESLDKKCTFQNLILEDEEAVMYSDEIEQYAATLQLLNTYLISTAKVKVSPTSYGKPIHKFHWILDKETVIEEIKASHEVEKPLPPPTKMNITSFDRIPHLMVDSAAEIDILAIVLRCGPQKNAGRSHHRCREITLCDNQKNQFLFTLWEDFGEIEGHEISSKLATEADLPTRYNSTVSVNPNYPQAVALINWAKENKTMLLGSPSATTSTSSSITPMIVTPAGQQIISIAEISSAPSMGVFYVEAEMAILDDFQDFCVLECSGCKQKKRTKDRKDFHCPKCNRKTSLVPRCSFQIDLFDNTAITTASISADLGEKLLSMTAEDIFDITCTKPLNPCLKEIILGQLKYHKCKFVHSFLHGKQLAPESTTDRTPKKIKPLETSEVEVMAATTTAGPSNAAAKFEPPTPTKKLSIGTIRTTFLYTS
ncbi:hypothetical protein KY285_008487 [Solanum tuberosum]|nr:hypothetical protein KY285_008487 [Solanum tuberosum]